MTEPPHGHRRRVQRHRGIGAHAVEDQREAAAAAPRAQDAALSLRLAEASVSRSPGRHARSSSKASAAAAQHARLVLRGCRRRLPDAHRRRDVAEYVANLRRRRRDCLAARGIVLAYGVEHVLRIRPWRAVPSWIPCGVLDAGHVRERAFSDVPDVRSRSLPGTDSETMSRGPSSLAVEPHRAAWIVEAHHREARPSALGVLRVAAGRSRLRRMGAAADARAARSSAPSRRDRRR